MKNIITTLGSVIPFLEPYPLWVKILSAGWIIFSAALLIVLIFTNKSPRDTAKETQALSAKPQVTGERSPTGNDKQPMKEFQVSLIEYFSKIGSFGDRFLEREEFLAELKGTEVVWKGYIFDIQKIEDNAILLTINSPTLEGIPDLATFTFTSDMDTKLFSLRKGDFVLVRGVFSSPNVLHPVLEGLSIERAVETKEPEEH